MVLIITSLSSPRCITLVVFEYYQNPPYWSVQARQFLNFFLAAAATVSTDGFIGSTTLPPQSSLPSLPSVSPAAGCFITLFPFSLLSSRLVDQHTLWDASTHRHQPQPSTKAIEPRVSIGESSLSLRTSFRLGIPPHTCPASRYGPHADLHLSRP